MRKRKKSSKILSLYASSTKRFSHEVYRNGTKKEKGNLTWRRRTIFDTLCKSRERNVRSEGMIVTQSSTGKRTLVPPL